jgi:hypothetical protein
MTYKMQRDTLAYKAANAIYDNGPMPATLLQVFVNFGADEKQRQMNINRTVTQGWLERTKDGDYTITEPARRQIRQERQAAGRGDGGQMALPRTINYLKRPPYRSTPRIPRNDEPEWSKRSADFRIHTVV